MKIQLFKFVLLIMLFSLTSILSCKKEDKAKTYKASSANIVLLDKTLSSVQGSKLNRSSKAMMSEAANSCTVLVDFHGEFEVTGMFPEQDAALYLQGFYQGLNIALFNKFGAFGSFTISPDHISYYDTSDSGNSSASFFNFAIQWAEQTTGIHANWVDQIRFTSNYMCNGVIVPPPTGPINPTDPADPSTETVMDPNANSLADPDDLWFTDPDNQTYAEYQQHTPWPTIQRVIAFEDWVGFRRDAYGNQVNCLTLAKEQLAKAGYKVSGYDPYGQTFQTYTNELGVNSSRTKQAITYMINAINNGIPILAGIDNRNGSPAGNSDLTTDHFVVIDGMGSDAGGNFFHFMDSSTNIRANGASYLNKLYYNENTGKITGNTQSGYGNLPGALPYTVTQVRKSIHQ